MRGGGVREGGCQRGRGSEREGVREGQAEAQRGRRGSEREGVREGEVKLRGDKGV